MTTASGDVIMNGFGWSEGGIGDCDCDDDDDTEAGCSSVGVSAAAAAAAAGELDDHDGQQLA